MKIRQIFAFLLCAVLLLSAIALPLWAEEGDNDAPFIEPPVIEEEEAVNQGLSFDVLGTYALTDAFDAAPLTLEAEICIPADYTDVGGVLLSNEDKNGNDAYLTFAIYKKGVPRVAYKSADGISYDFRFEDVDVRGEDFVKLAIVIDPAAGELRCYINGEWKQTLTADRSEKPYVDFHPDSGKNSFLVGGDATSKNLNFFAGQMRSLSVFSAPRSGGEILSDVQNGVDAASQELLCSFAFSAATVHEGANDASSNKNFLISNKEWFSAEEGGLYLGDYDFSLAVVGDTQLLSHYGAKGSSAAYTKSLGNLYQWIVDNSFDKKMKYVIGLGDITEKDTDAEWEFAKNAITKLDGILPYSLIRGQGHDTVPQFNKYFAAHEPFTSNLGGTFREGSVASSWQEFSYGETKYLIVSLDFGATDEILAWADGVVAAHPDHRVIVTTHAYLEKDGSTLDKGDSYNAAGYPHQDTADSLQQKNDGNSIWKKFASKHENIFLVLSGHMSADGVVIQQRKGEAGNTVTEMLIDPQTMDGQYAGGTGMVAMLYFSEDTGRVGVEYYSTNLGVYRMAQSFDVEHTHEYTETVVPPTCQEYGYTLKACDCGRSSSKINLVPKIAHTYDDDYDADCNACGDVREIEAPSTEAPTEESTEPETLPVEPEVSTEVPTLPEEEPTESTNAAETPSAPAETKPETESAPATETESAPSDPGAENGGDNSPSFSVVSILIPLGIGIAAFVVIAVIVVVLKKKK